jgi:hypothetical protein
MENLAFKDLDLSKEIQKAISEMGFEEATPIQSQAIPHVLKGEDVLGQAQTGTGKTCAFGIPAIQMMDVNAEGGSSVGALSNAGTCHSNDRRIKKMFPNTKRGYGYSQFTEVNPSIDKSSL